jgi:hypothetical protein
MQIPDIQDETGNGWAIFKHSICYGMSWRLNLTTKNSCCTWPKKLRDVRSWTRIQPLSSTNSLLATAIC